MSKYIKIRRKAVNAGDYYEMPADPNKSRRRRRMAQAGSAPKGSDFLFLFGTDVYLIATPALNRGVEVNFRGSATSFRTHRFHSCGRP